MAYLANAMIKNSWETFPITEIVRNASEENIWISRVGSPCFSQWYGVTSIYPGACFNKKASSDFVSIVWFMFSSIPLSLNLTFKRNLRIRHKTYPCTIVVIRSKCYNHWNPSTILRYQRYLFILLYFNIKFQ